jgi:hypothetical protein
MLLFAVLTEGVINLFQLCGNGLPGYVFKTEHFITRGTTPKKRVLPVYADGNKDGMRWHSATLFETGQRIFDGVSESKPLLASQFLRSSVRRILCLTNTCSQAHHAFAKRKRLKPFGLLI